MDDGIKSVLKAILEKEPSLRTKTEKDFIKYIRSKDIALVKQYIAGINDPNLDTVSITEECLDALNIEIDNHANSSDHSSKNGEGQGNSHKNILYYKVEWIDAKSDFVLKFGKLEDPLPPGVFAFTLTIDNVKSAINDIYAHEEEKRIDYLKNLMKIAKVGGTSTYNDLAISHLERFKSEIILQKGGEIKLAYLKNLGIAGVVIAFMSLLLYLFGANKELFGTTLLDNLFLTIPGACIGTWLTFALSNREIGFNSLRQLSKTNRNPLIRMIVMTLIAMVFYFMFITDFLVIGIGKSFSSSNISSYDHRGMAFLIGLFIGMAEATIGLSLTNRIQVFTSKL